MERVQFQQEQMLAELKDLVEKNLFTIKETKLIVKKRTAFETALVRRIAKKADFLRYAAYEMGLEQLRRKRAERLNLPRSPATISDYALVRRRFHIFERAVKRFRSDVGLWIQYIELAKREGAKTLVGRVTARALQLHPNTPALYILAASHELSHLSPSAARALLQRGIRLNADSIDMWREYVKMELGFIESLRRRWDVLGIEEDDETAVERDRALMIDGFRGQDDVIPIEVDDDAEKDEGEEARKEIMKGAIVKSVISNAVEALPKIELFESLNDVISQYPVQPSLRESLLAHLDDLLRQRLHEHPRSMKLLASRFLRSDMAGCELVEGIRKANEMLMGATDGGEEGVLEVYGNFIEQWCKAAIDDNLKLYLIGSLERVISGHRKSPSLLSVHIRVLGHGAGGSRVVEKARKYTSRCPQAASVWLERLAMEKQHGSRETVEKAWEEARRSVAGSEVEIASVWQWGLENCGAISMEHLAQLHEASTLQGLAKESMGMGILAVHEMILMRYVTVLYKDRTVPKSGQSSDQQTKRSEWDRVRHMDDAYLTTGKIWGEVFRLEAQAGKEEMLEEVYQVWRRKDGETASMEWAKWLLEHGKGKKASAIMLQGGYTEKWEEILKDM
ncbi:U3 small nucleolar RNA-associated protein 6-domain-containing protein [Armillaria borealis]|uniref:U3 small nucleolar RNA-associated protein 6-domain-containing protein n=1 Tax=Armillaria borealis TaxID=47425 RepID=A0AA39J9Z4_9AGAR|nr:U3 small nucleolar RNA-associated protein 6-domain-containing protein [Armillaria borealis]